jgi:DNA-binding LacI/PurR family transcriptional regulator
LSRPTEKSRAIRARIETLIETGEAGQRLPRVRDLMAEFQTSQRVVQRALAPLIATGAIRAKPGAGLQIADSLPAAPETAYATDCLILYRSSESRLARTLLMELVRRLRASGRHVTLMAFSDEAEAVARLKGQGRARCCLLQTNFEIVGIAFLAAIRAQSDALVIDGVSVTGIDADVIGTNWREALSIAYRSLTELGHRRIGFLTSSHDARQIAMARREFLLLSERRHATDHPLLYQVDALPGSYPREAIFAALPDRRALSDGVGATALIVWGLVDGYMLETTLQDRGLRLGIDMSVMLLGSVDVASEHVARFDVTGNSNAEKLDLFERIVRARIAGDPTPPRTHYLAIHVIENGSVCMLEAPKKRR